MLIIGNKKFAKNDKEFTSSLFDKTGTCSGFYEKKVRNGFGAIIFKDMQGKTFLAIVVNKHGFNGLVICGEHDGKIRYMYSCNKCDYAKIGMPDDLDYMAEKELTKQIFNQALAA